MTKEEIWEKLKTESKLRGFSPLSLHTYKAGISAFLKWADKPYADGRKEKIMTLSAMGFIRRFLLHVLRKGFMKIRHYGLLGNRNKTKKLTLCKCLTNTPLRPKEKLPTLQLIRKLIGHDITTCPVCGTLLLHASLPPLLVF